MIKVLVVSDNIELVSFFQQISLAIPSNIAVFDYCYSSINQSPNALKQLGMSVVNMKDQTCIDNLMATYELIISAHCKQIFPKNLVKSVRCINIHPGLNPYNRGWFPQVFSIINKKPIGCTIHLMDEEIDHGDIIYQKKVDVNAWDTSLDVYNRVISAEKELIQKHLLDLINGNYICKNVNGEGNYNGIEDFKNLTQLDLSSTATLADHIDLLRALTHGDFNNAYFIDEKGNKVFVKIKLEQK